MRHHLGYRDWLIAEGRSSATLVQTFAAGNRHVMTSYSNRSTTSMVWSFLGFVVLVVVLCENGDQSSTEASPMPRSSKCRITTNGARELVATTVAVDLCLCATDKASCEPRSNCSANQTLGVYPSATTLTVCLVDTASTTGCSTKSTSSMSAVIPAEHPSTNTATTKNPVTTSLDTRYLQSTSPATLNEVTATSSTSNAAAANYGFADVVTLEDSTQSGNITESVTTTILDGADTPPSTGQATRQPVTTQHSAAHKDVTEGPTVRVLEGTLESASHVVSVTEAPGDVATTTPYSVFDDTTLDSTTTSPNSQGGTNSELRRVRRETGSGKTRKKLNASNKWNTTRPVKTTPPGDISANPNTGHGDTTNTSVSLTPTSASSTETTNQGAKSGATTSTVESVTDPAPSLTPMSVTTNVFVPPRTDVTTIGGTDVTTENVFLPRCWNLSVPDPPEEPGLEQSGKNSVLVHWKWPRTDSNLQVALIWNGNNQTYTNDSFYKIHLQRPWTRCNVTLSLCIQREDGPCESLICGAQRVISVYAVPEAPGQLEALNQSSATNSTVVLTWILPELPYPELRHRVELYWVNGNASTNETSYIVGPFFPGTENNLEARLCLSDDEWGSLCGPVVNISVHTLPGAPSAVQDLKVLTVGNNYIEIEWLAPSEANGPLDFYRVVWAQNGSVEIEGQEKHRVNYNITGLHPWLNYSIHVTACNYLSAGDGSDLCGEFSALNVQTDADAPSPVPALIVASTGSTFVDVKWKEPMDKNGPVSSYLIKWARLSSNDSGEVGVVGGKNSTAYNISHLKPWSNYSISVRACNVDFGKNELCGEDASLTVKTASGAPSAPRNLRLKNILNTSMTIMWERPGQANGPLDGYEISWSIDRNTSLSFSKSVTSATLTGLKPYTTYKLVVRAFNVQNGKQLLGTSASLNGTTHTGTPGPPTSILGEATSSRLTLSWTAPQEPNGPLDGYNVTWAAKGIGENFTVTSVAEVVIDDLKAYTVYEVKVRAFNSLPSGEVLVGEEAASEHITCPDAPSHPTSVSFRHGTRNISLKWMVPEVLNGVINGYIVRLVSADGGHVPREVDVQVTETLLTELEPYTRYNVSVAAYNLFNATIKLIGDEYCLQVFTYPEPPGPMEDVQVMAYRNNSVKLSWDLPSETRGKLTSFLLRVNDTKGDAVAEQYSYPLDKVCKGRHCEHLFTRLHAECQYLFDVRGINEGVHEPGESPLNVLFVTVPPGDPPQAKNISSAEDGSTYQPYSQFLFSMAPDTFNDFNGAIVAYEVIASDSSCIGHSVTGNLTWGEVTSKDAVPPYLASPKGWNPFVPGSSDPMACSVPNGRVVCILGAQHCPPNAPMPCNGPLKPGKSYAMYVRGYTAGGSRATAPLHFSTEAVPEKSDAGAIAGGVIGGLIVGLILLAAGVYCKRFRIIIGRQKSQSNGDMKAATITESSVELVHVSSSNGLAKKQAVSENVAMSPEESAVPIVHIPKGPINKSEFSAYMDDMMKDSGYKFMDEYERLVELSPHYRCDAARDPANSKKNRFTNIHPFDKNRVPLSEINGDPHSSYINASFIQGFNGTREYVAAQGPNVTTINDFWRMIWEHDVRCIVMLTQCVEGNKKKCERYWPDEEQSYDDVQVKKDTVTTHEDYTVTLFSVKSDDSSHWRNLSHVFFTGWPDHGVPETPSKLIDFVRACQKFFGPRTGNQPPIVVHCSAGVGRTGTFIALDYLLQLLQVQETVNIFSLVLQLREGRRCMVQNENQYVYLHKCINAVLQEEESHTPSSNSPDEPIYENVHSLREVRA